MSKNAAAELADFLDQRARAVQAIEAEAQALIHGQGGGQGGGQGDQAGYETRMRAKAQLLAGLAADAQGLVAALEPLLSRAAGQRLARFAESAANSLSIGSPFYMSALLYPDEHKAGEPNDLERFADEVRAWG